MPLLDIGENNPRKFESFGLYNPIRASDGAQGQTNQWNSSRAFLLI